MDVLHAALILTGMHAWEWWDFRGRNPGNKGHDCGVGHRLLPRDVSIQSRGGGGGGGVNLISPSSDSAGSLIAGDTQLSSAA